MSYHSSSHEEVPGQQRPQTEHEEDQPDAKIPEGRSFQNKICRKVLQSECGITAGLEGCTPEPLLIETPVVSALRCSAYWQMCVRSCQC